MKPVRNEFIVDGERLLGPQGSNEFSVPERGDGSLADAFFTEFELPRTYAWQHWDQKLRPLRFARNNYSNLDGFQESQVDIGYFFGAAGWRNNIWANGLADAPFSARARRDLLKWRADQAPMSEAEARRLDTLTYNDYLEKVCGYDPAVTRMAEPVVGLLSGVSTDAACARVGRDQVEAPDSPMPLSYPGGNSPFPRALMRKLLPHSLPGTDFISLMYGPVNFAALNRDDQPVRMQLNATVLRVEHASAAPGRESLAVSYERGGSLFRVNSRAVVMASGGWVNKHILADMPGDLRAAYDQFLYAPALIVNVALRQWRFLYDLGITACRWFEEGDGIGYCCNIRQNMVTAAHSPVLHPDHPVVLSFYMGMPIPGLPPAAQGAAAREKFLTTSFTDFELRIRRQLMRLFGNHGFKPGTGYCGHCLEPLGSCTADRATRLSLWSGWPAEPTRARAGRLRPRGHRPLRAQWRPTLDVGFGVWEAGRREGGGNAVAARGPYKRTSSHPSGAHIMSPVTGRTLRTAFILSATALVGLSMARVGRAVEPPDSKDLQVGNWAMELDKSKFCNPAEAPKQDARKVTDEGYGMISVHWTGIAADGKPIDRRYVYFNDGHKVPAGEFNGIAAGHQANR